MKTTLSYLLLLPLLVASSFHVQAQKAGTLTAEATAQISSIEDTLGVLSYAVINDSIADNRFLACKSLITTLVRCLRVPNSFSYNFQQLQNISVLYPPDSTFRIFTWQLYVNENEYRYYGAIQMNRETLKLYPLIDRSFEFTSVDLTQQRLTPDRWYGAVYYRLLPTSTPDGKPAWLLFGFDGYEFFAKRKIIDVLTFENEQPVFGAAVFMHQTSDNKPLYKNRILLEYSADASVRCNYDDELGMIVFDHLMEIGGPDGRTLYVPDGTYEAYFWKNQRWRYIDQLPTESMDKAPTPKPILDARSKDLFGRENKG